MSKFESWWYLADKLDKILIIIEISEKNGKIIVIPIYTATGVNGNAARLNREICQGCHLPNNANKLDKYGT